MRELDDVRQEFVQLWGAMAPFWGISPTTARVYSWLLSRVEPADADEIMEGLELSRGAVSMACRDLRDWGLIFPEKCSGSRRILYRPATDFEKVIRNIVQHRKRREWDPLRERFREWIPRLDAAEDPEADVFRERLADLEAMVALADAMLGVFLRGGQLTRIGLKLFVDKARHESARPHAASEPMVVALDDLVTEERP